MSSAVLQWSWFADAQESRFQGRIVQILSMPSWKFFDLLLLRNRVFWLGNINISVVPPCHVVDLWILRNRVFRFEKFNYGCAVLEGGRSSDNHEFCCQAAKHSDTDCVKLQGFYLLIVRNGIFKSRNVQIIVVPSCKSVDLQIFTNSGFTVRNEKHGLCCPAMKLICWCSGIAFSGSETIRNVLCSHERTSIR